MEVAKLTITITSARCWREEDGRPAGETEDTRLYCSCEIPGEPGSRFATVAASGLDPVWNHTTEITGITAGDALDFAVLEDRQAERGGWERSEEIAGRAMLASRDFFPHGFKGEIPLTGGWATGTLAISISIEGLGILPEAAPTMPCALGGGVAQAADGLYASWDAPEVTGGHLPSGSVAPLPPPEELQSLRVTIVGARLPRPADWAPALDAYCTCQIAGEPNSVFSTEAVFNSLEPHWNYAAELTGVEHGHALEFSIIDARNRELVGRAILESPQFYPYGWHGELPVLAAAGAQGSLTVHVSAASGASAFPALRSASVPSSAKQPLGGGHIPADSQYQRPVQDWEWGVEAGGCTGPGMLQPPPPAGMLQPPPASVLQPPPASVLQPPPASVLQPPPAGVLQPPPGALQLPEPPPAGQALPPQQALQPAVPPPAPLPPQPPAPAQSAPQPAAQPPPPQASPHHEFRAVPQAAQPPPSAPPPPAYLGMPAKQGVTDSESLMAAGRLIGERRISMQEAIAGGNLLEEAAGTAPATEPPMSATRRAAQQAEGWQAIAGGNLLEEAATSWRRQQAPPARPPSPGRQRREPAAALQAHEPTTQAAAMAGYGAIPGCPGGLLHVGAAVPASPASLPHAVALAAGSPPPGCVPLAVLPGRPLAAAPLQRACSPSRTVAPAPWAMQPVQPSPACRARAASPRRGSWELAAPPGAVAAAPYALPALPLRSTSPLAVRGTSPLRCASPRRAISPRPLLGLPAPLPLLSTGVVLTAPPALQ